MGVNDELEKGKKLISEQVTEVGFLDNAFKSLAASISAAFEEVIENLQGVDEVGAKVAKSYERDIVGSIKKITSGLEDNVNLQLKINKGVNVQKEISDKLDKAEVRKQITLEKITRAEGLSVQTKINLRALVGEQFELEEKNLKLLEKRNKDNLKSISFSGILLKNISGFTDKLDKTGTLTEILKGNIGDVLTDARQLELAFALFVNSALAGSERIATIRQELGVGASRGRELAGELAIAAANSESLLVTTKGLLEANKSLNEAFGTAAVFNTETLVNAAELLKTNILSAEAISQLAGDAARLGVSFEEALQTQENSVNEINAATGAQINLKTVLEASNRISGQIRAQLGANPEAIARAVTQAKALGFELEQIAAAGKQILDFESSISAELEAELLTGKQLNLERARLAALTGDLETLTSEISANVGNFNDFSKLNVIQQEAIANAVGMSADELANSLITEENRASLLAEAVANNDELAVKQLKARSAAQTFQDTLVKIQTIIGDIGIIFAPILDGFASLVGLITSSKIGIGAIVGVMGALVARATALKAIAIKTAIANIISGNAKFGAVGIVASLAGIATMLAAINSVSTADDMGFGNNMLITKNKGAIMLNNQDSVIAGTNLLGGGGEGIDYDKMAMAMSKAQVNVTTKYNSFRAYSTTSNGGRYQSSARYESKFA